MERNPTPAMNLRMIGKIYKHDHECTVQYIRPWRYDRLTQFASKTNLRSNQSNDLFSAFCLGLNIFISQIDTYMYNNYKHYK